MQSKEFSFYKRKCWREKKKQTARKAKKKKNRPLHTTYCWQHATRQIYYNHSNKNSQT